MLVKLMTKRDLSVTLQTVLEEEGVMLEAILCTHKHW